MAARNIYGKIHLTDEEKSKLIDEIKYYFEEERDEKIGILASESLLDFFMNAMGTHIYNKALDDAMKWFRHNMENLESDYYSIYK